MTTSDIGQVSSCHFDPTVAVDPGSGRHIIIVVSNLEADIHKPLPIVAHSVRSQV